MFDERIIQFVTALPRKRSKSAEAAERRERERIERMTPLERIRLALELGERIRSKAPSGDR